MHSTLDGTRDATVDTTGNATVDAAITLYGGTVGYKVHGTLIIWK